VYATVASVASRKLRRVTDFIVVLSCQVEPIERERDPRVK
jgi:hypothetical protein